MGGSSNTPTPTASVKILNINWFQKEANANDEVPPPARTLSPAFNANESLLSNYDGTLLYDLFLFRAEEEGTKFTTVDLQPFINFFRRNNLQTEFFSIGPNQYLVTSIHEHWFCARCVNTTQPGGEGVIVMQIGAYLLVSMYHPFLFVRERLSSSQTDFHPGLPSAPGIAAQSQECLEKVAKTVSFLAQPEGSFQLLLTGEVQKDRALKLLNVHPFYFVYLCGVKT
ncbi:hypothetical protein D1007_17725 [Hordeum vulgare]|nr:hypothetical protein D1007_17725 [Hordeum vulgare]